jgi:DcmR-like sensory protein
VEKQFHPGPSTTPPASWEELLGASRPGDHVIQLYTDDAFLVRAVTRFLGDGLSRGEAAVLIATPTHAGACAEQFGVTGLDVRSLVDRGQLIVGDAEACLASFMIDRRLDEAALRSVVAPILERARAAGYLKVRLFGEMVDLLWRQDLEATVCLERLWNELITEHRVALLCAYKIDNFDRFAHRTVLPQICPGHSHLIPIDNYDCLDRAVDRAYLDVFGVGGDARSLRSLLASRGPSVPVMPSAQAALFAIRDSFRTLLTPCWTRRGAIMTPWRPRRRGAAERRSPHDGSGFLAGDHRRRSRATCARILPSRPSREPRGLVIRLVYRDPKRGSRPCRDRRSSGT